LTGGVFASFVSLAWKCMSRSLRASLGASGAISAMIGYVCSKMSDSQFNIIFLPQWKFSGQSQPIKNIYKIINDINFRRYLRAYCFRNFIFVGWFIHSKCQNI
jgi:membrane associated rhomboid family serine protease